MASDLDNRLELEEATARAERPVEAPRMEEPPPVRLVAVEDVRLACMAGSEVEMDELYVGVLAFEKEEGAAGEGVADLAYRAENFRLVFHVREGLIQRQDYRPVQVEVPSLREVEHRLMERELEYTRQRGLTPGSEMVVVVDGSGNYVEVSQRREVM